MAEKEELSAILEDLEKTLIRRASLAARRSPETFLKELEALELVIDLRKKLQ